LIVEDDLNLGYLLVDFMESEGYEIRLARDGEAGLKAFLAHKFDLCILDVMLPKMDGFTLADEIRKLSAEVPLIFLTAKSFQEDKLHGFKSGADDYITKPFDETELVFRIKAILKRVGHQQTQETAYQIGRYSFDALNQSLAINGNTRRITAKESEILLLLCQSLNQIVKRHEALNAIYGKSDYFHGRSFDVFITRLRKYFKEDPGIEIQNIHGVGFILSVG
jgi:DNA-binding response OmpR family regulator